MRESAPILLKILSNQQRDMVRRVKLRTDFLQSKRFFFLRLLTAYIIIFQYFNLSNFSKMGWSDSVITKNILLQHCNNSGSIFTHFFTLVNSPL